MEPFTSLTGITAPLSVANINTDILIRVERMMAFYKGEMGPYCFETWRYLQDGSEDPDFVLNKPAYRGAKILIGGLNFGCGSSREQAVWALYDMGFRCVIAPGFGDIFFNNCFQNAMLPIVLEAAIVDSLIAEAQVNGDVGPTFTVDLRREMIVTPMGREIPFKTDARRRHALLEGLDDIGMTLAMDKQITAFQTDDQARRPWIYAF